MPCPRALLRLPADLNWGPRHMRKDRSSLSAGYPTAKNFEGKYFELKTILKQIVPVHCLFTFFPTPIHFLLFSLQIIA